MQYAARLPSAPSAKTVAVPLVALVLGAAAATGAYALIDDEQVVQAPKVIVLDAPAPAGVGTTAKDEAGTAAAIGAVSAPSAGLTAKDEAGTAAAIGAVSASSPGVTAKDEAATAAAIGAVSAPSAVATGKDEAATAAAIGTR